MTSEFNKLGTIKELGAILHRIDEQGISDTLRCRIIERHYTNLYDTLPVSHWGLLRTIELNVDAWLWENTRQAVQALRDTIPLTYGCIPAGSWFMVGGVIGIKRKDGVDFNGTLLTHYAADTPVTLINH